MTGNELGTNASSGPSPVPPDGEADTVLLAFWDCGHIEVDRGVEHRCDGRDVCTATFVRHAPVAAGRAAASPDPPDEDAIRADERERPPARVYENDWCPTCAAQPAPGGPIPGPDPGACPRCGGWRKAGMIHRCPAATPDPPDPHTVCVEALAEWWAGEASAAEVTGWMNGALQAARLPELDRTRAISMCNMVMADLGGECDYGAVVSNVLRVAYPAASPDERLREALTADAIAAAVMEWDRWPCRATTDKRPAMRAAIAAALDTAALAAADREAPDEETR